MQFHNTFATPNIKASTQPINSYLFLISVPYQPLRSFFSMGLFISDVAHSVCDLSVSGFFHSAYFGSSSSWKHVPTAPTNSFPLYMNEGAIHLSGNSTPHHIPHSWVESRVEFLLRCLYSPLLEELPSGFPLCFLAAV